MYSNPPLHGARLVGRILSNPQYKAEWIAEMKSVSARIVLMRTLLRDELVRIKTKGTWGNVIITSMQWKYILIDRSHRQSNWNVLIHRVNCKIM